MYPLFSLSILLKAAYGSNICKRFRDWRYLSIAISSSATIMKRAANRERTTDCISS